MVTNLEVILVTDEDSYQSLWLNGINHTRSSSDLQIIDVLRAIESFGYEHSKVGNVRVYDFRLYEARTSDIPEDVKTVEALQDWYKSVTGEELCEED